ncbi:MAG: PSD1 and planctomycete cytochrome C domain-containing protein [Planctomycetota bacterium]
MTQVPSSTWPVSFIAAGCSLALCVIGSVDSLGAAESTQPTVDFARQVQPILAKRCFACHGPDVAESGLSFVDRESALTETESGDHAIVAGDLEASTMIARITSTDEYDQMPPEGDRLTTEQIEVLKTWIKEGAAWSKHWSFQPMKRYEPPSVDDEDWNLHPIDRFLYRDLADRGLSPNPPADRSTLIRRATYDLTGLPPSKSEIDAFVASESPEAFEDLVDSLLQSPHYGEQWGRHWLDLVRFAETNSFERDGKKTNAYKFRDYVIRAFNDDKPYDQFVREQLAGDELDQVTAETLAATGFYRLGIWDDEPADPKQARFDELDDIITTTGQAFLGLTINCARCHDHKIDPIPQANYYSLLAFFEDITPFAIRRDTLGYNQIDISSPKLKAQYSAAQSKLTELRNSAMSIEQAGIAKMDGPLQRATEGPKRDRNRVLKEHLQSHLTEAEWSRYRSLEREIADQESAIKALPPRETVMGLAKYRVVDKPTYVLYRGNPHSPADEVGPGFPTLFGDDAPVIQTPQQAQVSTNSSITTDSSGRRRHLADWVASEDNLLTARVMANRVWQFHFGRGLVRSSNNFGQLGTPPTHPELLDWLAWQLIDQGWRLKPLHRLIMSSRAYQMSSAANAKALEVDPNNDLFWRFNRRRLSAEEVRDSILAVNGSLNPQVYGPSFFPKLSAEVLAGQSRPGEGWGQSSEQDRNRRSVYIFVKRSLVSPLLTAFDFPDPDLTCEARFATLQPGQALALLNGEFIHQAAERLAGDLGANSLSNTELVSATIERVLGRTATADELAAGDELILRLQNDHQLSRDRATTLYCLTVLNWNEFLFLD